jgi:dihydrofolate reductase
MRKMIQAVTTSLDGFIADANGNIDEFALPSEEVHRFFNRFLDDADAIIFGRVMYQMVASYWDAVDPADTSIPEVEAEFARIFQGKPRYVVSRTLDQVDDRAVLIRDNVASEVSRLKEQDGGYLALGSGPELVATLVESGLIDEFRIITSPVVLGRGKALFGAISNTVQLRLLDATTFESGSVLHCYAPVQIRDAGADT